MEAQNISSLQRNEALVGKTLEVLAEGPSNNNNKVWSGRTRTNKLVLWPVEGRDFELGDKVQVQIETAQTWLFEREGGRMTTAYTPMVQQYLEVKRQHEDELLFFRLGDFYEMFFEDALTASRELNITLTGRAGGMEEKIPMCGVPYHSVDNYIAKLIKKRLPHRNL